MGQTHLIWLNTTWMTWPDFNPDTYSSYVADTWISLWLAIYFAIQLTLHSHSNVLTNSISCITSIVCCNTRVDCWMWTGSWDFVWLVKFLSSIIKCSGTIFIPLHYRSWLCMSFTIQNKSSANTDSMWRL